MTHAPNDLLSCFRAEAAELLDTLARGCLDLEKADHEASLFDELNRAAHSLKGAARLVELFEVSRLAHTLEDSFAGLSERDSKPTKDEVTKLLESVDELKQLVEQGIAATEKEADPEPPSEGADARETEPAATLRTRHVGEPFPGGAQDAPTTPSRQDDLTRPSGRPAGPNQPHRAGTAGAFARVSTHTLMDIGRCSSEVLELTGRMTRLGTDIAAVRKLSLAAAHEIEAADWIGHPRVEGGPRRAATRQGRRSRADAPELRRLVETLARDADRLLSAAKPLGLRLHRLALDAQTDAVSEVSPRFERIVRDVASDLERNVVLAVIGSDVRIDRHVLQRLTDPISHLLRNAVAHGVEPADVRAQKSKPPEGRIQLSFEKRTDSLRVVVEDDGAGLDYEAVRQAAHAGGGAGGTAQQAAANGDVAELIFRPGVTTAPQTSQVSGRGIGLDVVRTAVEQLHGTVFVESEPGQFCRFNIEVPSHLDVMNVFVLGVAGQDLLVPLANVVRTYIVKQAEIMVNGGLPALVVNGQPVRLVQLHLLLGLEPPAEKPVRHRIAVLESAGRRLAVEVDSLQGKWRAVIKGAGPVLAPSQVVAGAAIMSDGRPAFLLKPDAVVRLADARQHTAPAARSSASPRRKAVLVVDDSLTTRMLEKAVLEAAGYRVVMACDGAEALECIAGEDLDLAVIDFEMPGMNGDDLAQAIREHSSHPDLPLIMLTSRSSDEDRQRGLAAGFQAYLVKGQFEQAAFLNTVQRLIGDTEVAS